MEPCSDKSSKEKKRLPNELTKAGPRRKGAGEGEADGRLFGRLSLGKQAGSAIRMSKAGYLFGVCCGKCSRNPPRTISMMPFTSITSRLPAHRCTFSWPAWPPGAMQQVPWIVLTTQCSMAAPFFCVRLILWSPAAPRRQSHYQHLHL